MLVFGHSHIKIHIAFSLDSVPPQGLLYLFLCFAFQSVIDKEEIAKVAEVQTVVPCPPGDSTVLTDVSTLYDNFGDHSHQAEVKRINKMLDSNKLLLDGPSDLSLLLDWSGWMLAPKEIV